MNKISRLASSLLVIILSGCALVNLSSCSKDYGPLGEDTFKSLYEQAQSEGFTMEMDRHNDHDAYGTYSGAFAVDWETNNYVIYDWPTYQGGQEAARGQYYLDGKHYTFHGFSSNYQEWEAEFANPDISYLKQTAESDWLRFLFPSTNWSSYVYNAEDNSYNLEGLVEIPNYETSGRDLLDVEIKYTLDDEFNLVRMDGRGVFPDDSNEDVTFYVIYIGFGSQDITLPSKYYTKTETDIYHFSSFLREGWNYNFVITRNENGVSSKYHYISAGTNFHQIEISYKEGDDNSLVFASLDISNPQSNWVVRYFDGGQLKSKELPREGGSGEEHYNRIANVYNNIVGLIEFENFTKETVGEKAYIYNFNGETSQLIGKYRFYIRDHNLEKVITMADDTSTVDIVSIEFSTIDEQEIETLAAKVGFSYQLDISK